MKFYSGFSLQNEVDFFKEFIKESDYTICGFSYGAINAFRDTQEHLKMGKRVDTLQLFSPVFFQTKNDKFKRVQSLAHSKNKKKYMQQFIDGCFHPYLVKELEYKKSTADELDDLLHYEWFFETLQDIADRGVNIEVYLGGEDKIIDVNGAREFFLDVSTVTYIKNANHFLQIN